MQVYITNPGTLAHLETIKENGWGLVRLANHWSFPKPGIPWFLDNGAYSYWKNSQTFDSEAFRATLKKVPSSCSKPDFLVCPDIYKGGKASLNFSLSWLPKLPRNIPAYLAVQDGMTVEDVEPVIHWFKGLFVGGSYAWKVKTLVDWVDLAHTWDKKCHVGQIGTYRKLLFCRHIGADSVDSSNFVQVNRGQRYFKAPFSPIAHALAQCNLSEFAIC